MSRVKGEERRRRGGEAQEPPAYKHTQTEEGRGFHLTAEDGTSSHVLYSILSPWLHMDLMSEQVNGQSRPVGIVSVRCNTHVVMNVENHLLLLHASVGLQLRKQQF